jgi:hypothetical protein
LRNDVAEKSLETRSSLRPWLLLANTKTANKHKLPGF